MMKSTVFAALALTIATGANVAIAQDRFFNSKGVRIRYVEQGTGEARCAAVGGWRENGPPRLKPIR
jgi:hypothetical protein